jgi:hypothetical protein
MGEYPSQPKSPFADDLARSLFGEDRQAHPGPHPSQRSSPPPPTDVVITVLFSEVTDTDRALIANFLVYVPEGVSLEQLEPLFDQLDRFLGRIQKDFPSKLAQATAEQPWQINAGNSGPVGGYGGYCDANTCLEQLKGKSHTADGKYWPWPPEWATAMPFGVATDLVMIPGINKTLTLTSSLFHVVGLAVGIAIGNPVLVHTCVQNLSRDAFFKAIETTVDAALSPDEPAALGIPRVDTTVSPDPNLNIRRPPGPGMSLC